ncbi:MAG TPA: PAS domain-containing protein, partial [Usitatibacter sp.]|nr:PAS domain-containing protein [Usitatibacter sp.]
MATDDFKRIFESLRVAVVIADAKGAISYGNSAFGQLASDDARSMNGVELTSLFAKEDRKRVQQNVARVGEGKAGSAFFDAMLTPKDRTPHWVSVALQPSLDAKDKAEGVIAILQDIGTQRETDEALNLVTARLLAIADVSPTGLLIETAPGDIELVNEAFCRTLSLDSAPQSLSGLAVWEVLQRSPVMDKAALAQARRQPAEAASIMLGLADGRGVAL